MAGRPKGQPKTGGRKKGSSNRITKAVKDMILGALSDVGGQEYLVKQAKKNPTAFLTLIGKVLPLQVNGSMTIRTLAQEIKELDAGAKDD